ncbi:MAG TPA: UTP--glucose-1-phosphate uridylyltransferase [Methylomirabilota bacterium]|nr:UTP--glucose-1-phosphate uridylyltransferase [Methylomirabilota bacterium]
MAGTLVQLITSGDQDVRNRSLDRFCGSASADDLLAECEALETFRQASDNLYERVRALFFLYAIHRYHLPTKAGVAAAGHIPFEGYEQLLKRRFSEALGVFLKAQKEQGPSLSVSSALASAYHGLGFQTLADQVRKSVRSVRGNQWMFRIGHPMDQPLRIRPELKQRASEQALYPILRECTPVRMDLSHSAWSDIFFLGMDFPEGAQVLNVSIDLAVRGRDGKPRPPVEAYLRVIDEPVLRLTSIDLGATADIIDLPEVFDFAKDYLGLLKAAVIASGIVPPGLEGSGQNLSDLLEQLVGPGLGLEVVSNVNNIPKGSRLAVSTNLLASLISACMRATGQAKSLIGPLEESERRLVAARAILGEWIGGSGGGWQDSGGVWPGIKLIRGMLAEDGDVEFGTSRGRLLPSHQIFGEEEAPQAARTRLEESLVLVHGGMAQNVGPILEMVTEKYLLRSEKEWEGRQAAISGLKEIIAALGSGDAKKIGELTTGNFFGPIQTIIPWASTFYTETLIEKARAEFKEAFWGFWMLGGMSGGGMGFIFDPKVKQRAQDRMQEIMLQTKRDLEHALPFAMDPVVYDFAINQAGTSASLLEGDDALMPPTYYSLIVPALLRMDIRALTPVRRLELDRFGQACRVNPELGGTVQSLFDRLFPQLQKSKRGSQSLHSLLEENGFDRTQHEQVRADLRQGRIGLAQNRLPPSTTITDVEPGDVLDASNGIPDNARQLGLESLKRGEVAVVTLAAGVGSRWTQGAGVVKALHPFCKLKGRHRTFIEVHLAKSRRISRLAGTAIPHIVTTSYLTHEPIAEYLSRQNNYGYDGPVILSAGRSIGLRMVPMVRDLRFAWEVMPQQTLDEQAQKVRKSVRAALMEWARKTGEGSDYTENVPLQCLHPVGHWYEPPNLLRNGTLLRLLKERPQLKHLLLHNIDTLGADVDPSLLGLHIESGAGLTFEVITRKIEDRGGGLARVNGQVRLVEGLAMPHEESEFALSYYNTLTTWINIDAMLKTFQLTREDLADEGKVTAAVRELSYRMPTYVTLKDVKRRWGHGQEDIFPVMQFEKLWGDMTALPEVDSRFVVVPRPRGQQLKDQAQLDGWLRDGSAAYIESISAL